MPVNETFFDERVYAQIDEAPVVRQVYYLLAIVVNPAWNIRAIELLLRSTALLCTYQMIMVPIGSLIDIVFGRSRSRTYVNFLKLMCLSFPSLYDVSVVKMDFGCVFYVGMWL